MISRVAESLRTVWFFVVVVLASIPSCTAWILMSPITRLLGDPQRHLGHYFSTLWARTIVGLQPWWRVRVEGREHLAPRGEAVVYVANHQHEIDILLLFQLRTRFRWLSKMSVFHVPLIGWSMWATGYVGVVRGSHKSHAKSKAQSLAHLAAGTPMLFFPEGTFGDGTKLDFKTGAFRLAQEAKASIVPITVGGSKQLFRGKCVQPGDVHIRVFPRIELEDRTAAELSELARAVMEPALGLGDGS